MTVLCRDYRDPSKKRDVARSILLKCKHTINPRATFIERELEETKGGNERVGKNVLPLHER